MIIIEKNGNLYKVLEDGTEIYYGSSSEFERAERELESEKSIK